MSRHLPSLWRLLLGLLLVGWSGWAAALTFDEHTRQLPLGPALQVFEDLRGSARISDVSSPALAASFQPLSQPVLNVGYTDSAYWLCLDLDYRPQQASGQGKDYVGRSRRVRRSACRPRPRVDHVRT